MKLHLNILRQYINNSPRKVTTFFSFPLFMRCIDLYMSGSNPATPAINPVNTGVYGIFTFYILPIHSYLKLTFLSLFNKYQFRNFTSLFINYSIEILGKSSFLNTSKFSNDHIQSHRWIFYLKTHFKN